MKAMTISKEYSKEEKLKAAYALNMCTVSVSQIVDYKDAYILEQEYDAILNNLNLKEIPKDEALLRILTELLNTITFFRIQDIKKKQIEKKYQQRMKNAIWSAIPNINMIISGNPVALAISLATQVGIGYMNYRKEKSTIQSDRESSEVELEITAIEQLNALRRELFTTAWRLADTYDFDDKWRLTEKQIKQYNEILMDRDELRKYVRLESIQNKFEAFPPFWYFLGHTACSIAEDSTLNLEIWEREEYRRKAKIHFSHYESLNVFNILREDQLTASFALEYVDLLLLEENPDKKHIADLLKVAIEMSGNANDIKQLCAISYLKIGNSDIAAKLLMQLVNEEYNTITNAKLLSRIYVSQFLTESSKTAKFDYKTLQMRVGQENYSYLFPMPADRGGAVCDKQLQQEHLVELKSLLITDYNTAINQLLRKYTILFNQVIPAPYGYECAEEYYGYTVSAIQNRLDDIRKILNDNDNKSIYLEELANVGFRFKFIDLLNKALEEYDDLLLWRTSDEHDTYIKFVRANVGQKKQIMKEIQDNMNSKSFSVDDYKSIQKDLSFRMLLGKMLDEMKQNIMDAINNMVSMEQVENAEYDLAEFCRKHEITLADTYENDKKFLQKIQAYISYDILGSEGIDEQKTKDLLKHKKALVREAASELILDGKTNEVTILLPGDENFDLYFKNKNFNADSLKTKALGIVDDTSKKDCDLLFDQNQLYIIKNNKIKGTCRYDAVIYNKADKYGKTLELGVNEYTNKSINIGRLFKLIEALK